VQTSHAVRGLDTASLLYSPPLIHPTGPLVTVAVRSRLRANRLQPCLDSLLRLEYAPLDLVLIDGSDDCGQVQSMVRDCYPRIRYSRARGLGPTTRQAVLECRGDILALTDGDAVVDPQWVSALVHVFLADPDVMTVSGLVLPPTLRRPLRPALPAGAPFCRRWWRARDDADPEERATERAIERASSNVAYWRPADPLPARFTCVWEPAAIVHSPSITPVNPPPAKRGPTRETERAIDLADGIASIGDASADDSIRLRVSWSGRHLGTVRIPSGGAVLSRLWIADAIAQQLTLPVLDVGLGLGANVIKGMLTADLARYALERWGAERTPAVPRGRTAAA
jgi:glycosyltransferase involved in cell wall biosynthesis